MNQAMKFVTFGLGISLSITGCSAASQNTPYNAVLPAFLLEAPIKAVAAPTEAKAQCSTPFVRLDINFPSGAANSCEVVSGKRLKLTIIPEDEGRINDSPWYAFRLTPIKAGRVTVELHYKGGHHRYWPKTSANGQLWKPLPKKAVLLKEATRNKKAILKIKLGKKPMLVAGQEIIVPATYDAWARNLAKSAETSRFLLGKSAEGRNINGLRISAAGTKPKEQVVIVGRQHPPEVTGALALFPFVDAVAADTPLAKKFRARFETIVVPMLNPDGVVRGHWRHNTGSTDLNRDWGPFKQPETKLMDGLLKKIDSDADRKLRFFLDFHSTQKDVFYTIPDANPTNPPLYIKTWLARLQERMPKYKVNRDQNHNAASTVSKAYVYNTYKAPAVTFELGDETDRKLIRKMAHESSIAMMETLLATEAQ